MSNRIKTWCLRLGYLTLFVVYFSMHSPISTKACVICIPYPRTTLADQLIENNDVIMARESARKPYSFYTVAVLKGTDNAHGIDAFINSSARRMLKQNPDGAVVFRRENKESGWHFITYADIEYQEFIRAIVEQSARWQQFSGERLRIDFFAQHLNHNHRLISEQAYLEVGRAPYVSIKRIARTIPRQQIYKFLANWQLTEWHSLYILMLGSSQHPDDLAYIRQKLDSAAAFGLKTNLSAWVTAFIEAHPDTGVEEIEKLYFSNKDRTRDELQEVLKALSVLGSDVHFLVDPESIKRQSRIVSSYSTLLKNYPIMAGAVANDLTVWKTQALIEQLSNILEKEPDLDPNSKMAVSYYLSIAPRFQVIE